MGLSAFKTRVQETCRHCVSMKAEEVLCDETHSSIMLPSPSDSLPAYTVRPSFRGVAGADRQRHCCEAGRGSWAGGVGLSLSHHSHPGGHQGRPPLPAQSHGPTYHRVSLSPSFSHPCSESILHLLHGPLPLAHGLPAAVAVLTCPITRCRADCVVRNWKIREKHEIWDMWNPGVDWRLSPCKMT